MLVNCTALCSPLAYAAVPCDLPQLEISAKHAISDADAYVGRMDECSCCGMCY
jgi:hypothetical protein